MDRLQFISTPKEALMKIRLALFSVFAVGLFTASTFAQQIKTDYDRNVNFGQYKTYSWGQIHTENPLWVDRIKASVNSALAAKGWTEVDSGGSISIMAMEINETHHTLNTYYDSFGGGWRWGRGGGFGDATTTEETYRVGTLVIDLFDTNAKTLIWRGSATDVLSNKSDKNIKNLNKRVAKLFSDFPPEQKSQQGQ
jgi:hypothetical protein